MNRKKIQTLLESFSLNPMLMISKDGYKKVVVDETDAIHSHGFSNDLLISELKSLFFSYRSYKELAKHLSLLIDKKVIFPAFTQENFNKLILTDRFKKNSSRVLGFFDTEENHIVLLLNNVGNSFGMVSDLKLFELVSHELQHYAFYNHTKEMIKEYISVIVYFYHKLLKRIEGSSINVNKLENLIILLILNEAKKAKNLSDDLEEKILVKSIQSFLTITKEGSPLNTFFSNLIDDSDDDSNIVSAASEINIPRNKKIFEECYKDTMKKFFLKNNPNSEYILKYPLHSYYYQELLFPSEILSLMSGYLVEYTMFNQFPVTEDYPIIKTSKIIIDNKGTYSDDI